MPDLSLNWLERALPRVLEFEDEDHGNEEPGLG
jgi:hypothetical protein